MTDVGQRIVRRVAALLALLSFLAAGILLVVAAVANLGPMLMMLFGLVVVILGSWHLVTRRGAFRILAAGLAVAGLALLVAGFVWADFSGGRVAVVLLLSLVSVGTAHLALPRPPPVGKRKNLQSASHPVLIMNLKSGGGKAEQFHLVDECRRRGIEPVVLGPEDDLEHLAEDAVARGADVLGMAGGDGSQALVASVAVRHDLPYVVVPAGTRNHFALDLGLNRDDVVGALDAFAEGVEFPIDLATINGRVFVNNATLGLYAKIIQSPEYRDAKRQTTADMLPDLLGSDAAGLDLRFSGPDAVVHATTDVLLVSNNPYELHRFSGRGTRERLDRGVLGIASVSLDSASAAAKFITLELAGQVRRFPGWQEWTAQRFEVDAAEPVDIGVDGEALRLEPPLVFESLPSVLRIRLPSRASGRSPAAQALHLASGSTFANLGRTAAGLENPTSEPTRPERSP